LISPEVLTPLPHLSEADEEGYQVDAEEEVNADADEVAFDDILDANDDVENADLNENAIANADSDAIHIDIGSIYPPKQQHYDSNDTDTFEEDKDTSAHFEFNPVVVSLSTAPVSNSASPVNNNSNNINSTSSAGKSFIINEGFKYYIDICEFKLSSQQNKFLRRVDLAIDISKTQSYATSDRFTTFNHRAVVHFDKRIYVNKTNVKFWTDVHYDNGQSIGVVNAPLNLFSLSKILIPHWLPVFNSKKSQIGELSIKVHTNTDVSVNSTV